MWQLNFVSQLSLFQKPKKSKCQNACESHFSDDRHGFKADFDMTTIYLTYSQFFLIVYKIIKITFLGDEILRILLII
jgi:hypothetical protein